MATLSEIEVTLTARDNVTPVLKRIRRRLWWMQYGDRVVGALMALLFVAGFILGRVS